MSKEKKPIKGKIVEVAPKKEEPTLISKKESISNNDSIMAFYLRAFLLAAAFMGLIWYVVINNYHDMAEAERLAKKQQSGQALGEELKKLTEAQKFQGSSDFKWFYNYKWVYHNLLQKNLDIQRSVDTLDMSGRQAYKNGTEYQFMKIIMENTPKDAVILMPDASDLAMPEGAPENTPKFTLVGDKAWCYYFLYPRKLVYEEADSKDMYDSLPNFRKDPNYAENRSKVTHVAIVYGRGYEHLKYTPATREAYIVLPINAPDSVK